MCRGKLCEHLSEREDWSPEAVVDLEFVNKSAAPKPESSLNHDDWVSACRFPINGVVRNRNCRNRNFLA
jgi:hypothetical protein